jgi:hypothetical protein
LIFPKWERSFVIAIASETGWTEEYIRWHLPMARAWGYYHAVAIRNGNDMVSPDYQEQKEHEIDNQIAKLTRQAMQRTNDGSGTI